MAVTAAARKDDKFGKAVTELVADLRTAELFAGVSVVADAGSTVFIGDAQAKLVVVGSRSAKSGGT